MVPKNRLNAVTAAFLCLFFLASGCSHQLHVRNMSLYKPEFTGSVPKDLKLGITSSLSNPEEERLLIQTINGLKMNGFQVIYPFVVSDENRRIVDYILKFNTSSQYNGSGWNFLINWPGFLIWTPAWHGYNYQVVYGFDVDIIDAKSNNSLPRLTIPIDMEIRHAAMNRTWTEISWLEWGAIALIGGILFTKYDKSVTPILLDNVERKIGDYVSSKVANAVLAASPQISAPMPLGVEMRT